MTVTYGEGDHTYVTVKTHAPLSDDRTGSFMQLFLRTKTQGIWDYTVCPDENGSTAGMYHLTCANDFTKRERVMTVAVTIRSDSVTYDLPKSAITEQWFKVCDSTEEIRQPEDFYDKGDTLPAGRMYGLMKR